LMSMQAVYEIPYGVIERAASGEEEPGQSWLDVSGVCRATGAVCGLSLLNDGKYSFDVNIRDIGLTVVRSPIYAHHIPVVPDPDGEYSFIDQGMQEFTYALLPHAGGWESAGTARRAAELNQPPVALALTYHPGPLPQQNSFAMVDAENVNLAVLKRAEDGTDLVLRAVETARTAVEAQICLTYWGRVFTARFNPSEIKTFRIPLNPALPVVETNLLELEEQVSDE
jgi:alpha-mannosidase